MHEKKNVHKDIFVLVHANIHIIRLKRIATCNDFG